MTYNLITASSKDGGAAKVQRHTIRTLAEDQGRTGHLALLANARRVGKLFVKRLKIIKRCQRNLNNFVYHYLYIILYTEILCFI
jgi:hypothetical protein